MDAFKYNHVQKIQNRKNNMQVNNIPYYTKGDALKIARQSIQEVIFTSWLECNYKIYIL